MLTLPPSNPAIQCNGRVLVFTAQSATKSGSDLSDAILKFISNFRRSFLERMSEEDLARYVKSIIENKLEPDKKLSSEVNRNWAEISNGRLQFDRPQLEAAELMKIKKSDVLRWWDDVVVSGGGRVLCEIVPQQGGTVKAKTGEAAKVVKAEKADLGIGDIDDVRNMLEEEIVQ